MEGVIYKGIGGFYYVQTGEGLLECKARGVFRNRGEKPLAGDRVEILHEAGTPYINAILPRRNAFVRPPVANVDQLIIVASTTQPAPSQLVLDTLTVLAFEQEAQPVLVCTKNDLRPAADLTAAYKDSGIPLFVVNAETGEGIEAVRGLLRGKLSVFCGNSGVGKSTLLNAMLPQLRLATGEISHKLGRGKHTTREVELFEAEGGLVADTPGFASLDVQRASPVPKENLQFDFPEIRRHMEGCRFTGCAHLAETGCAVCAAVEAGDITPQRYASYKALYEEAKQAEKY